MLQLQLSRPLARYKIISASARSSSYPSPCQIHSVHEEVERLIDSVVKQPAPTNVTLSAHTITMATSDNADRGMLGNLRVTLKIGEPLIDSKTKLQDFKRVRYEIKAFLTS